MSDIGDNRLLLFGGFSQDQRPAGFELRIFNSSVKSVLLYGCETWRTTKTVQQKIQTFFNTCLRHIFNIRWPEKIRNKELGEMSEFFLCWSIYQGW
nr:hypothetical protein BaRGS_010422 [Batillaria attramentaria]